MNTNSIVDYADPEPIGMSMATEPARIIGLVSAAVASILALVTAIVPLSPAVTAGIMGVIAGVGPLAAALLIRGKVFSPKGAADLAVELGAPIGVNAEAPLVFESDAVSAGDFRWLDD